ncbi:YqkE family protein [Paenibacillus sp. NPDC058174]|uniref:YqkE family protein n=1 Tax=Paenibacillus sp. NPDC058174 TaxID=3346366 RepID=UPI0036DB0853
MIEVGVITLSKKRKTAPQPNSSSREDKAPTLKDMLSADILQKLKQQAEDLKASEEKQKQDALAKAEEARKQEQKRNENDMNYLLDHYKVDNSKYK